MVEAIEQLAAEAASAVEIPFAAANLPTAEIPLARVIEQLRQIGFTGLPAQTRVEAGEWTPAQEQEMARLVSMDAEQRVWIGSIEVTEIVRRQLEREISDRQLRHNWVCRAFQKFQARAVFSRREKAFGSMSTQS